MDYQCTQSAEDLIRQYQMSGDVALREKLAEMHLHIAGIVARRFAGRGVEYDDLYQVASLALLKAIERFDPGKGIKFASFATPTMVGEVKNYFRDKSRLITLPRRGADLLRRLRLARDQLEQTLSRAPTPVELAEALDSPLDTVLEALEMQGAASPYSLDSAPDGADESPMGAFLGVEERGFAAFEQSDQIKSMLDRLPGEEREVIIPRYFEGLSQREVAQLRGVSQMTVSRVERRALEKLRKWMTEGEH